MNMSEENDNPPPKNVAEPVVLPAESSLPPACEAKNPVDSEKNNIADEFRDELKLVKSLVDAQAKKDLSAEKKLNAIVKFCKQLDPFLKDLQKHVTNTEQTLKVMQSNCLNKSEQLLREKTVAVKKQLDVIKDQSGTINKLQECMTRYENDVLYKSQKEILADMIELSDQVRLNISEQEKNKDYDLLLDSMKNIGKWIDSSLERSKMHKYGDCAKVYPDIDKKRQEVVGIENTDCAENDGCFVSLQPGYLWAIPFVGSAEAMLSEGAPQKFEFVFRPEQVVKLKYEATNLSPKCDK